MHIVYLKDAGNLEVSEGVRVWREEWKQRNIIKLQISKINNKSLER